MLPPALRKRLDALIDELIMDGGIESASLASILLTARDSVKRDDHVRLSRLVWAANNEILAASSQNEPTHPEKATTHSRKRLAAP